MREEQIVALLEYIDARIIQLIAEDANRDTLYESVRTKEAKEDLKKVLGDFDE